MSRFALLRVATLPFRTLESLAAPDVGAHAGAVVLASRRVEDDAASTSDRLFAVAGHPPDDAALSRARFALLRVRRDVHAQRPLRATDVAAAGPLVIDEVASSLEQWEQSLGAWTTAREIYRSSWHTAMTESHRRLVSIAASPLVEHGLYLGSRSLLPKWRRIAEHDPATWRHGERHTAAKVSAYVARFATKTSPNGVFCAVAPAWVDGTNASVRGRGTVALTDVLLSLAEVRKVAACLAADPDVAVAVVPRPNPTLRERDGLWTWWQAASPRHPTDEEVHAQAKDHPVLRAFVEATASETLTLDGLLATVAERTGIDEASLRTFFARLVDRGVLIAELEVPWSARRRFRQLAATAARGGARAPWIATLERIESAVDRLPTLPLEARPASMDAIAREVEALPRRREFRPDELFRVDSASALEVRLPARVLDDLRTAMSSFTAWLASSYPERTQHRRLVQRFLAEHPPDVDISFLDLYGTLAEPTGPDTAPPTEFPAPSREAPEARASFERLVRGASQTHAGEELTFELDTGSREPRWCAGVLFQIAARSVAELEAGRYRIVINGMFNGIGLALSRFTHLLQEGRENGPVVDELRRAWSCMERPGAVLAELTFNHEARTANAGLRPILFRHEIELPGDRATAGVENVPLADLVLRYESATDRLVLRSRSQGVEIVPVLGSGVSPSGIVSTLIHIGRQGLQTVGYLPGLDAIDVVHWPRISIGPVVLFRERWVFAREALTELIALADAEFFLGITRWRESHRWPRHVFVHTSVESKPFYVDLESPPFVDLVRGTLTRLAEREGARFVVTEMLPAPDELWVRDEAGAYASEFLVQMEGPAIGATRSSS